MNASVPVPRARDRADQLVAARDQRRDRSAREHHQRGHRQRRRGAASGRQASGNSSAIATIGLDQVRGGPRGARKEPADAARRDHSANRTPGELTAAPWASLNAGTATSTVPMQKPTGRVVEHDHPDRRLAERARAPPRARSAPRSGRGRPAARTKTGPCRRSRSRPRRPSANSGPATATIAAVISGPVTNEISIITDRTHRRRGAARARAAARGQRDRRTAPGGGNEAPAKSAAADQRRRRARRAAPRHPDRRAPRAA